LPGLVVSACVDCEVLLLEPRAKRAAFLEMAMGALGRRCSVFRGRLEEGGRVERLGSSPPLEVHGGFRILGARAVFGPDLWLERAEPLMVEEGVVVLHLSLDAGVPDRFEQLSRVEFEQWALVVGRPLLVG